MNSVTSIPLLLLSGWFATADNFAPYLIPVKYISYFKYAYQTLVSIEFNNSAPVNCYNFSPTNCSPLSNRFQFLEPFYVSIIAMVALIFFFKGWAYLFIHLFSKVKV